MFLVQFLEYLLLFMDDNLDEEIIYIQIANVQPESVS